MSIVTNEMIDLIIDLNKNYTDSYGLITHKDGDSGDGLQRNATYHILKKLLSNDYYGLDIELYRTAMDKFEVKPGIYVRHPDVSKWYSNPNNCSRDQISIALLAMCMFNDTARVNRFVLALIKRFGFFQNHHMGTDVETLEQVQAGLSQKLPEFCKLPIAKILQKIKQYRIPDVPTPSVISSILRSYRSYFFYPALIAIDLFLLLDVLVFRKNNPWDADNMLAANILVANTVMRTPISMLAMSLYKKTDYKEKIYDYYTLQGTTDLCKPLGMLYTRICKALIG